MILERDGVALNVAIEGEGPPVVLLHGHALDLRVWEEATPWLVRGGFRVIRYDQRGHGRSSSPLSGYRWSDHAADLAEVIGNLDAAPAHLVGLSKGGGIALELAVRRPELVRSLTLVGPLVPDFILSDELMASFRELAKAIRSGGVQEALSRVWLPHPLLASAAAIPGVRERLEAMLNTFRKDPDQLPRDHSGVRPPRPAGAAAGDGRGLDQVPSVGQSCRVSPALTS
jgi:3-oxoadipate enol-lactonase